MMSIFPATHAPYFQFQMRFKDIAIAASPKMAFPRLCSMKIIRVLTQALRSIGRQSGPNCSAIRKLLLAPPDVEFLSGD